MKLTQYVKTPTGKIKSVELDFPKRAPRKPQGLKEYVSSPAWFPRRLREWLERELWDAGKLHDNDRGNRGVIPKKESDAIFCQLVRYRGYNRLFVWMVGVYLRVWGK
jgi:hypothetical protein